MPCLHMMSKPRHKCHGHVKLMIDRSLTIEDIKSVLAAALLTPDTISTALELLFEPKEDCYSNNFLWAHD